MSYALSTTVPRPFDEVVTSTRSALSDNGFGVLTEIDLAATLREKLGADVEVAPQVVLGACRPSLALQALQAEPSVGLLLPCNLVVRVTDAGTVVEAVDPATMVELAANPALQPVADDARQRLAAALASLTTHTTTPGH